MNPGAPDAGTNACDANGVPCDIVNVADEVRGGADVKDADVAELKVEECDGGCGTGGVGRVLCAEDFA